MATERDLEDVLSRERALLDTDVRLSPERLRELLHPSFMEFGASGTVWTLESVLSACRTTRRCMGRHWTSPLRPLTRT